MARLQQIIFWKQCMGDRTRRQGGGTCPPPLEFEKMTSYAAVLQNTLNFSLAPSALALHTLYLSLKRRKKKRKNFRLRLRRAKKWSIFFVRRAENVSAFSKCWWFCHPPHSGKISAGAHGIIACIHELFSASS